MINAKYSYRKQSLSDGLQILMFVVAVLIVVIAFAQKESAGPNIPLPGWAGRIFSWSHDQGWWTIPSLTVVGAVAKLWREKLERDWLWYIVQEIIDRIAFEAFLGIGGPAHHRATLFRHQWCWCPTPLRLNWWPWGWGRWPGSGWLVPIVRSGHATQRSRTVFLAPDDADNIEGVVGAVWSDGRELTKRLPRVIDRNATLAEIEAYSRETWVTVAWITQQVAARKGMAASFRGLTIEVKGRKWGVIILDSRDPAALQADLNMPQHAFVVGKLLERTAP